MSRKLTSRKERNSPPFVSLPLFLVPTSINLFKKILCCRYQAPSIPELITFKITNGENKTKTKLKIKFKTHPQCKEKEIRVLLVVKQHQKYNKTVLYILQRSGSNTVETIATGRIPQAGSQLRRRSVRSAPA